MRIGELAQCAGVSVKTVRYYESIGVLEAPSRTSSGYRDYDSSVISAIGFVRAAKSAGLTLGEIRQIVAFRMRGETPCAHVAQLLESRSADLTNRIKEMERMRSVLAALADRARALDQRDCSAAQICHIITPELRG